MHLPTLSHDNPTQPRVGLLASPSAAPFGQNNEQDNNGVNRKSQTVATLSAAATDANAILAVAAHVKQDNITFIDDNRMVTLFERWSHQG